MRRWDEGDGMALKPHHCMHHSSALLGVESTGLVSREVLAVVAPGDVPGFM